MDLFTTKQPYNILIMNCRQNVQLDTIAALFHSLERKIPNLPLEIKIKTRYFEYEEQDAISEEMSEALFTPDIFDDKPDCGCLVFNARESRLSINEPNAGIGFYKIYTALKQITDDHVVIIVAKDSDYKKKNQLVSDSVLMKVSSQFKRHYLYGPLGYVFSWHSGHQAVHEETMLKFILPTQWECFIDDLKPKVEAPKPEKPIAAENTQPASLTRYTPTPETQEKAKHLVIKKPPGFDNADRCQHNVLLNIKEYCRQLESRGSRSGWKVRKVLAWNGHDIDERFGETVRSLGLGDDENVPQWLFEESREILQCKQNPTLIAFISVKESTGEIEIITKDIRNLESFKVSYDIFQRGNICAIL